MSLPSLSRRQLLALLAASPLGLAAQSVWAADNLPISPRRKPAGAMGNTSPTTQLPLLVIDPGHGGRDPGAIGVGGTYEKDVTLDLARKLADQLRGRMRIALTRDSDKFIALPDRVAFGRAQGAHLFVSLHADSAPDNNQARGLSAYTLSTEASDSLAAKLADSENLVDQRYGAEIQRDAVVADILHDLAAEQTIKASRFAKEHLIKGVARELPLLDNPKRSANFAVLRAPDMPSVLIETGFLSNPQDEARLSAPQSRSQIAQVLARELSTIITHSLFT